MVKTKYNVDVLMDIGNSETRYYYVENEKGVELTEVERYHECMQTELHIASNHYATLSPMYSVPEEYSTDENTIFQDTEGVTWANGKIVDMEFAKQVIKPHALQNKVNNSCTMLTIQLILANILYDMSNKYDIKPDKLDVTFNLLLLLPPFEVETATQDITEKVMSIKTLKVKVPTPFEAKVNIANISTYPEGYPAFMSSMFAVYQEEDTEEYYMEVRPECEKYFEGEVLLVDIGAGTTDIMLFRDGRLVQGSKETVKRGGNNVVALFQKNIKREYDITIDTNKILNDCVLTEGMNTKHNVEECLNEAKRVFAKELINSLQSYLESQSVETRLLRGLVITGGGSLSTIREGKVVSPALGDMLTDFLKELAPYCEVVTTNNPRHANILGLKLLYMLSEGILGS